MNTAETHMRTQFLVRNCKKAVERQCKNLIARPATDLGYLSAEECAEYRSSKLEIYLTFAVLILAIYEEI